MKLYDIDQSGQMNITDAGHDDKPLNTFGNRDKKFEGFKV
jgi:hypothetical protein